jgi:hypothetical protein
VVWHNRAPDEVTRGLRLLVLLEITVEEAGSAVELMSRSGQWAARKEPSRVFVNGEVDVGSEYSCT